MKKIVPLLLIILLLPLCVFADTIFLKDGTRLDVQKAWEGNGKVKYNLYGTVYSFPKNQVQKIEKAELSKSPGPNIDNYPLKVRSAIPKKKDSIYDLVISEKKGGFQIDGKAVVKKEIFEFIQNLKQENPDYQFQLLEDEYLGVAERSFVLSAKHVPRKKLVRKENHRSDTKITRSSGEAAKPYARYQGSGDDVIRISKPGGPALFQITGNRANRHFSVMGNDDLGNRTGLFANTTETYAGIVLVDPSSSKTSQLEIKAHGPWVIEVYELKYAKTFDVPGMIEGKGDSVLKISGTARIMEANGNPKGRHFSIKAYSKGGRRLLVNTTDPYQGKVRFPTRTLLLEISAMGPWMLDAK